MQPAIKPPGYVNPKPKRAFPIVIVLKESFVTKELANRAVIRSTAVKTKVAPPKLPAIPAQVKVISVLFFALLPVIVPLDRIASTLSVKPAVSRSTAAKNYKSVPLG